MDGVIVLDKPGNCSSHDAVVRARRVTQVRRIGHLGTLDPIATGVLPLVVGKATRLSQFFLGHDREYKATFRLGFSTDTYDRAGQPTSDLVTDLPLPGTIERAFESFKGVIQQRPPAVSAKKVDGVPAYKRARKDEVFELASAEVTIYELEILSQADDLVEIRVRTSAGAYVRSLAHDIGRSLGCGAHVAELRRTSMGEFSEDSAWSFAELEDLARRGELGRAAVPGHALLPEIPNCRVDEASAQRIAHGREFRISAFSDSSDARRVKAIAPDGRLLAIGELKIPGSYHPAIVF